MDFKKIPNSMLAHNLAANDPLVTIMHKAAVIKKDSPYSKDEIYWNQHHYHLAHSSYFNDLPESKQQDILLSLNHKSLSLSYYIEKFGLNYGAKMILAAESTEEKSLYALFSSDEVKHRLWLESFLQKDIIDNIEFHPLLNSLGLCLNEGNKNSMVFTIQVILEGFGLFHYGNLRETCQNPKLKEVFSDILKDEALHHGMGVVLAQRMVLDKETKSQIFDLTARFVRALIEAEWVLKTLNENSDGLTTSQVTKFKQEIGWQDQIQARTEKLKALIKKVGYVGLVEELEGADIFSY